VIGGPCWRPSVGRGGGDACHYVGWRRYEEAEEAPQRWRAASRLRRRSKAVSLDSDWPQQGGWLVVATWKRCEKEGNEIHGAMLRQVCRGGGTMTTRWSGAAEGRCGVARGAVTVTSTRIIHRPAAAAGYAIATPTLPPRPPPRPPSQVEFSRRLARGAGREPRLAERRSQRRAGVWVWRLVLRGGAGAAAEGGGALGCGGPVPAAAARVTQIAGKDPRDRWACDA
jgi:hypothetical protein